MSGRATPIPRHLPRAAATAALAATIAAAVALAQDGATLNAAHAHGGGLAVDTGLWLLMMVAMMLPATAPWMATFADVAGDAFPTRRPRPLVVQFVGGYLAVWLVYSMAAAALQGGLQQQGLLSSELRLGASAGGVMLIAAGLFQFSPLKEACLRHCRNPLSFFLSHWDGRASGPLRMGARHGLWCVGCCWALMALAFVLGVMNLLWMAAITGMVILEQWAPRRLHARRVIGVVLMGWGATLLLR